MKKDTAVVDQAAVGRPKVAVVYQRVAHRLRLAATAKPHLLISLKNYSLDYNRALSHAYVQARGQFVGLSLLSSTHYAWHLGTVGYNSNQMQQRNGLGLISIRSILATGAKMLVGHAYDQPRAFCPCMRAQY